MASLYSRKKSSFWWIEYRRRGKIYRESTRLRMDDRGQSRKAKQLCATKTAAELEAPRTKAGENWGWVQDFINARYAHSPLTRIRYTSGWFAVGEFFKERGVRSPRTLTYADVMGYLAWRQNPPKKSGVRKAKHNTALVEIKSLSGIMREAVRRGLAESNPCAQLGIKRMPAKEKPEISPDEIAIIEARLTEEGDEPMRICWRIAMLHACRLTETCVDLGNVDLQMTPPTITFRIKGGRAHSVMLHPDLVPLFQRLKEEGKKRAYEMPPNWAKKWRYFFHRCGLDHLTFHCTRVTGVTALARAGVDLRIAMDYVGHRSGLIHSIYQRLRPADHATAANALRAFAAAPAQPGNV